MKKKVLIGLMVGCSLVGMGQVPVANASEYDFNDTFTSDNDMLRIDFTVAQKRTVTFFSSSADNGGFDPILTLWSSDGALLTEMLDDGNVTGSKMSNGHLYDYDVFDVYFDVEMPVGNYSAIVTQMWNTPKTDFFSDGFYYDGAPHYTRIGGSDEGFGNAPYFNNNDLDGNPYTATGNLVFHILNVDTAVATYYNPDPGQDPDPVPVPGALLLLGSGLAGLVGVGFKRKK
jgi:hypothetical protein